MKIKKITGNEKRIIDVQEKVAHNLAIEMQEKGYRTRVYRIGRTWKVVAYTYGEKDQIFRCTANGIQKDA